MQTTAATVNGATENEPGFGPTPGCYDKNAVAPGSVQTWTAKTPKLRPTGQTKNERGDAWE